MKSVLDPAFKYYSSVDTDLRRTFQRIREEMRQASIARSERRQPHAGADRLRRGIAPNPDDPLQEFSEAAREELRAFTL